MSTRKMSGSRSSGRREFKREAFAGCWWLMPVIRSYLEGAGQEDSEANPGKKFMRSYVSQWLGAVVHGCIEKYCRCDGEEDRGRGSTQDDHTWVQSRPGLWCGMQGTNDFIFPSGGS
jgi:hypothetical protein